MSGASITSAFTPTANDGLIVADVNGDLVKRSASSVLNASAWLIGGNTLGASGDLGTNDAFGLNIRTNSASRITVSATGDVAVLGTAGTPNLTLTSVSGVAAATVPVGFDRALIANNTGQVSQASFSAILASGAWTLTGNAGTNPATNFLGTTDAQPLAIRTNNAERIRVLSTGEVGIGTSTPLTNARMSIANIAATTGRGVDIDMATQADIQGIRIRNLGAPGTDGAGIVIGSTANGTGTGIRIGSTTAEVFRPNIGIAVQATSNGYTFVPNTSGAAIAYRAGNTANADRPRIGFEAYTRGTAGADAVAVRGNANAASAAAFGVAGHFLTEGSTGILWPLLVSSANNNNVYLGSSAADVPAEISTLVGSTNANTTYMFNARMSGTATFVGSTSGTVSLVAPAVAGTQAYTLPSALPVANNHVMVSTTGGIMSWADPATLLATTFWRTTGNAGTNPATNFLGTTDNVSLRFRTNNAERMVIDNTGRVGIGGSLTPTDALDVDNGNLRISTSGAGTAGSLRLEEDAANGNNYIGFRAPAALASDRTYTLPSALGTVGQVLVITATGGGNATLDWGTDGTSIFEERPGSNAGIRRRAAYLFGTSPDGLVDIYANDFQGRRALASQTASGNYSGTFSGQSNTASGTNTVIVGGISNRATNTNGGVLAGSSNTANGTASVIVGGTTNTTNGNNNFIGAGTSNTAGGSDAAIVAGNLNALSNSANNGFIGGGQQNSIGNATSSAILGGESNTIGASAHRSAILGGSNNEISSTNPNSAIWGGQGLTINSARTAGINLNNGAGTASMTVNSLNTIVLGNGDVWLANTNNTASALRFYEPQAATGTFPAAATQYTSFRAGAQTVNIDYTLPTALPVANNHVMVSSTAGIMAWADPAALVGNSFWALGGNAVASAQNLGTTSNFALPIITNNVERMRINATGEVGIGTTAAAGYSLHVGGTAGTPNVRLASVGGAANATAWVPTANDGVITADNNGDLSKRTAQAVVNAGLSTLSGTVNLTAGSTSIVVPNTNVTATSRIVVTYEDASAAGFVATMVTTRVVGASFTVAFSGPIPAGATGRLHYIIVNP